MVVTTLYQVNWHLVLLTQCTVLLKFLKIHTSYFSSRINWLVFLFLLKTECVLCEVRTVFMSTQKINMFISTSIFPRQHHSTIAPNSSWSQYYSYQKGKSTRCGKSETTPYRWSRSSFSLRCLARLIRGLG